MPKLPSLSVEFARGLAALRAGDLDAARSAFRAAVESGGRDAVWACQELIRTYPAPAGTERVETLLPEILPAGSPLLAHALGYLYRRAGRAAEASAWLEQAWNARPRLWAAATELGYLRCRTGRAREGRRLLARAEASFRRRRDAWGLAGVVMLRATEAVTAMRLGEAERRLEEAARLKSACGDRLGQANALHNLGLTRYYRAEYAQATESFEAAIAVLLRLGQPDAVGRAWNGIGLCLLDLADPAGAREAFEAAHAASLRAADRTAAAAALGNLGFACKLQGDLAQAQRHYHRALLALAPPGDLDARLTALGNLAEVQVEAGRARKAQAALAEVASAASGANQRTRLIVLREQVRADLALGRTGQALRRMERSAGVVAGPSIRGLAAEWIPLQVLSGRALLARGEVQRARRVLASAVRQVERLLVRQRGASVRMGLLETQRRAHDALIAGWLQPSACGRSAAGGRSAARGGSAAASPARAFALSAGIKARELLAAGALVRGGQQGGMDRALERSLLDASVRPAGMPAAERLGELRRRYREEAERAERRERSRRPLSVPPDPEAVGRRLGTEAALVEYHVAADRSHAFLVHAGRVEAIELPLTRDAIGRQVEQLVGGLHAGGMAGDPRPYLSAFPLATAHRLYRGLVEPVIGKLPAGVRRLVVVPDGPLHRLPFELLPLDPVPGAPADALRTAATVRYLVDRFAVSYLPATALLRRRRRLPPPPLSLCVHSPPRPLVVGNAEQRPLAALPGARAEVRSIARVLPSASPISTASEVLAAAARPGAWVHVAAHAVADETLPGLSALVLAPERVGVSASLLTADRVRRRRLRAELVVLAACESGAGKLRPGEGLLGLARAFLEAGAGAVLASLWMLEDTAARDLTLAFYRELARGRARAEALAEAKRGARRLALESGRPVRAHPFFWASFILVDRA